MRFGEREFVVYNGQSIGVSVRLDIYIDFYILSKGHCGKDSAWIDHSLQMTGARYVIAEASVNVELGVSMSCRRNGDNAQLVPISLEVLDFFVV